MNRKMILDLIKTPIKRLFSFFGLIIMKEKTWVSFYTANRPSPGIDFLFSLPASTGKLLLPVVSQSRSQNYQDLFVLSELGLKEKGFFVEFGATNGIHFSNSFLLEDYFGWNGILAEPAKGWHKELRQNRPFASIEEACVWKDSGSVLIFNETSDGNLSTLDIFSSVDSYRETRKHGERYEVSTISLTDLLEKYSAPKTIDYLSIDTEGSEFEILSAFDFEKYSFSVITCEHNYTPAREKIYELLTSKGYIRKYEELSLWDDWYVKP